MKGDGREWGIFAFSVAQDTLAAYLCFHLSPLYFHGTCFFLFPIVLLLLTAVLEYVRFLAFDFGCGGTYKVKMSWDPMDHLLIFVVAGSYEVLGLLSDFGAPLSYWDYPLFPIQLLAFDFVFGVGHYLAHKVPALWRLHQQHHEYQREDLNCFASLFAHIYDSLLMNMGFLTSAFLAVAVGGVSHFFMQDLIFTAIGTHQKYVEETMQLCYFFEYDVLDMLFEATRISSFHNLHHQHSGSFFAGFGSIPDNFFVRWVPRLFGGWLGLREEEQQQPAFPRKQAAGELTQSLVLGG